MTRLTKALHLLAARRALGLAMTAEVQAVAQDLLTDVDLSTEAVVALASRDLQYLEDALALFDQAAAELGLICPTPEQAAVALSIEICRDLLAGALSPREGCQAIAVYAQALDTPLVCLDPFVYADSSLDDTLSETELATIHASIRKQAREFLNAVAR